MLMPKNQRPFLMNTLGIPGNVLSLYVSKQLHALMQCRTDTSSNTTHIITNMLGENKGSPLTGNHNIIYAKTTTR